MKSTEQPTRIAHGGLALPPIGFGTYPLRGSDGVDAISRAITAGYTLLDSAVNYENEGAVGRAIRESGVAREQLIVTSKLPGRHHATDQALRAIEESTYRMGLERIDLYLIHWPNPARGQYVDAWKALVAARDRGLVGAIGVSNFLPEHILRLGDATGELPEVNQIELHPHFPQEDAVAFHAEHGILTEAWSPLGRDHGILTEPAIIRIAEAHGVGPGEIVLAWAIARGVIPIPKAASATRQIANLAAVQLSLSPAEVTEITGLGKPDGRIKGQDPAVYEEM